MNRYKKDFLLNLPFYFILLTLISAEIFICTLTRDLGLVKTIFSHLFVSLSALSTIYLFHLKKVNLYINENLKILFVLLIYFFISFLTEIFINQNLVEWPAGIEEFTRFFIYAILCYLTFNYLKTNFNKTIFFYFFNVISLSTIIYSFFQINGIDFHLVKSTALFSFFGNPNFFANFIILAVFINLAGICYLKNKVFQISSAIYILIYLFLISKTDARASWLGIISGILLISIILFLKFRKLRFKIVIIYIASFIIISTSIYFFKGGLFYKAYYTLKTMYSVDYGSGRMRINTYMAAMRIIKDNFFLGTGIGTYQQFIPLYRNPLYLYLGISNNQLHTHSEYLEIWTETGIIGLIIYLIFLIYLFLKTFKYIFKNKNLNKSLICIFLLSGILGTLVQNIFSVNLRFTSTAILFWFTIGLLFTFIDEKIYIKSYYSKSSPSNFILIFCYLFFIIFILVQSYCYYNMFKTNQIIQTATSYERPDSKFYDANGREVPKARYNYLVDFYTNAISYNKYAFEPYYKLGHAYYNLGQIDNALKTYKALQRSAPFYANLNFNISLIYFLKNDVNNTLYYLKREIYSNAKSDNISRLFNYMKKYYPKKDSSVILRNSLWIEPENPNIRARLAYEYILKKKYRQAMDEYYKTAYFNKYQSYLDVNQKRTKVEAIKNIGVIYYSYLNDKTKANKFFQLYSEKFTELFHKKPKLF